MKRLSLIAALCTAIGAAWFFLPPAEHIWSLSDVSRAQEHTVTDWFHSILDGQMAIRVIGSLDSPAILETPLGSIELPPAEFDFIAFSSESWSSSATLRFSPTAGAKGYIKTLVCLGSGPEWTRRPPSSALPKLYTGGWTAYYPGTDIKAWTGGFHQGIRWGEFIYYDQSGKITRREEWENGRKKS